MNPSTRARRIVRWTLAILLALAGVVSGWLALKGLLALPLPEAVLFSLSALTAITFLAGAVFWNQFWGRALLVGAFVGIVGSTVLVLLFVTP
jgi:hypothetical protein